MSVLNETYKKTYEGKGATGPYPITFDVNLDDGGNAADIVVKLLDADGVETDITSTSTVTGMNVYTTESYGPEYTVVLIRYPTLTQPYTFPFGTKFPSRTFEKALDRLLYSVQRVSLETDQSLKVALSDPSPARLSPVGVRANTILGFDSAGDPIPAAGGAAPVTPFMATVLDDLTAAEARATLGVGSLPYIIAAYDAPSDWAGMANYQMPSAGSDLSVAIATAVAAGIKWIRLSPGNFTYTSTYAPNSTGMKIRIEGCGPHTTLITNGAAVQFIAIGSSFTGKIEVSDFGITYSGTAPAIPYSIIDGYSLADGKFNQAWRNIRMTITGVTYTGAYSMSGFGRCTHMRDCEVYVNGNSDADVQIVGGFAECAELVGCKVNWDGNTALAYLNSGFYACISLVDCLAIGVNLSTTCSYNGYTGCYYLSSCRYTGDDTGFNPGGYGFSACYFLSACVAEHAVYAGFSGGWLSGCRAYSCGYGFAVCEYLTACYSASNGATGFSGCQHVVACKSESNANYGFQNCKQCQQNYATGNTSGQYTTSWADQSTNACANTSAGGYNR